MPVCADGKDALRSILLRPRPGRKAWACLAAEEALMGDSLT
jgi:hypothetical protein